VTDHPAPSPGTPATSNTISLPWLQVPPAVAAGFKRNRPVWAAGTLFLLPSARWQRSYFCCSFHCSMSENTSRGSNGTGSIFRAR
jgi:hypothetical protein